MKKTLQIPRQQKRQFVVPLLAATIGKMFLFSEEAKLLDLMSAGRLHMKESSFQIQRKQEQEQAPPALPKVEPNYPGHVHLNPLEKLVMIVGFSIGAFVDPSRNEFIVGLGESTAFPWFLQNLKRQMLMDPIGRTILQERPRMTSESLNLDKLRSLPENSIGSAYVKWLDREGVSPDTRVAVKYIDDEELAYIFQRYRECHDFYHTLTGLPIIREGEIALKCFEFLNLGIPMTGLGALFAPWNTNATQRERLFQIYYPWLFQNLSNCKPLINVYWEKILDRDIDALRLDLGLTKPPDMRLLRKLLKLKKKQKI